jgi:DNA-binding LacI/PurR family transcriptional regulator
MSMEPFRPLTVVEQLAQHLRGSIARGEIVDTMPGIRRLATLLAVSSNTVTAAMEQLEREGFLEQRGHGRRCKIILPESLEKPAFRITLLPYERADVQLDYTVEIQHRLRKEGYIVSVAEKSLVDLGMAVKRVAQMVQNTETDAWIVFSAPQEILEWFVKHSLPTFALFGRFRKLPLAATGLNKAPAFRAAIRRLAELGHRRIVLFQPKHNRVPSPAYLVRESLAEMEAHGIKTGPYNLPEWEQSPAGLRERLDSLFSVSPPTAIIFDRPNELIAAQHHLGKRGIFAPQDVSIISDDDPTFEWYEPGVCCIAWHSQPWVSRVVRWVGHIAAGKDDKRQLFSIAKFIEKGTIGPAPQKGT